jgi:hypothetical protein
MYDSQRRHTNGQHVYEKRLTILNQKGNESQNHNEKWPQLLEWLFSKTWLLSSTPHTNKQDTDKDVEKEKILLEEGKSACPF